MKKRSYNILFLDKDERLFNFMINSDLSKYLNGSSVITESTVMNEVKAAGKDKNPEQDYLWALNIISRALDWDLILIPYIFLN